MRVMRRAYILVFIILSLHFVDPSASDLSISDLEGYFRSLGYDIFSVNLQLSLEHFQYTYGLKITGQLDNETTSLITQPRCGVPDFINGSSNIPEDGTMSFQRFWPAGKKDFTYAFSPGNPWDPTRKAAFADAFDRWSNVTGVSFIETPSFNKSDIQIMLMPLDGKIRMVGGAWFNPAVTQGGVYLDNAENWVLPINTMTETDQVDMESVVMHQIGHMLGFSHTTVPRAVMYPYLPLMQRKLDFAKDESETIHQFATEAYNGVSLPPLQTPLYGGAAGGLRPRWGLVPTIWLGIFALLFGF